MEYQTILVEYRELVCNITLNRLACGNALNEMMCQELLSVLAYCEASESLRVVVIRSVEKSTIFCSGVDLNEADQLLRPGTILWEFFYAILVHPLPIIVVTQGKSYGGGAQLCLLADVTIADKSATLCMTAGKTGYPFNIDFYELWLAHCSLKQAKEIFLMGKILTASEALEYGVISSVSQCVESSLNVAIESLTHYERHIVSYMKYRMNQKSISFLEEVLLEKSEYVKDIFLTHKWQEKCLDLKKKICKS